MLPQSQNTTLEYPLLRHAQAHKSDRNRIEVLASIPDPTYTRFPVSQQNAAAGWYTCGRVEAHRDEGEAKLLPLRVAHCPRY